MPGPRPQIRRAGTEIGGLSRLKRRDKRSVGRQWKVLASEWVDPYPWVLGTFPEKLVFAWLADRNVPFEFQWMVPDYPGTLTVEEFRADFALHWCKTVIEVQGEYWHSRPEQAEKDVYKFAIYEAMGYSVAWLWESDILENLGPLLWDKVPSLRSYYTPGGFVVGRNVDDLAGLRTVNAKSRVMPSVKLSKRRVRSGVRSTGVGF